MPLASFAMKTLSSPSLAVFAVWYFPPPPAPCFFFPSHHRSSQKSNLLMSAIGHRSLYFLMQWSPCLMPRPWYSCYSYLPCCLERERVYWKPRRLLCEGWMITVIWTCLCWLFVGNNKKRNAESSVSSKRFSTTKVWAIRLGEFPI